MLDFAYLRKIQLEDIFADSNRNAELDEFKRLYEEKADTDAALLYPELEIAKYLILYFEHNCLQNISSGKNNIDEYGNNLNDLRHPPLTERVKNLTTIAKKQKLEHAKKYIEESTNEFKAQRLGIITPQKKPFSGIELIRQKYMPNPAPTVSDFFQQIKRQNQE